jgi:serine/threonine protein kinase
MASPGVPKSLTGATIAAKYLIGPLIGKGSFGEVFLATVEGSSELYAIKKVSNGIIQEDEGTKHPQLIAESKIVKCFEKIIGFPRVYWVGQENRATFMVMELLGPTL